MEGIGEVQGKRKKNCPRGGRRSAPKSGQRAEQAQEDCFFSVRFVEIFMPESGIMVGTKHSNRVFSQF